MVFSPKQLRNERASGGRAGCLTPNKSQKLQSTPKREYA